LSSSYSVVTGDTFELIARKLYGDQSGAAAIREANPGVPDPPIVGTVLVIPDQPSEAAVSPRGPADSPNEVAILIDGRRFRKWSSVTINEAIDQISSVEFTAPFEPGDTAFRDAFRPFSFATVDIEVNGRREFTGTLVGVNPSVSPDQSIVTASCYALPGVLGDCTMPASAFPLEFNNTTLREITAKMLRPFGIRAVFEADPGPRFERVGCDPGRTVLDFLADLARQRNLVIGNDERGSLVFRQSPTLGSPVANLEVSPLVSVTPAFNPQQYFSHITGLEPVTVGLAGSQFTVKNPRLAGSVRPMTFTVTDADAGSVSQAVQAKAGRMFANMVSYSVGLSTWRTPAGDLWRPGSTVNVLAPRAMIYRPYEFEIRGVTRRREADSETATLDLIIPGAYAGRVPEVLPWDD
jgi:prophage tail gpP-like protein/phage tail protein X